MGRRHIQAVRRLDWELSGVYDVSSESLKAAQTENQLTENQLFDDLDEFFKRTNLDCLIIATTADSHCKLTCLAAERGVKFILVEKPMAVSLQECDLMIQTCKEYGARLAVNHQMRFMEQYTKPKEVFSTPEFGGLTSMTVIAGNFGFAMNCSHYFEAFRFLTNENIQEVSAWFSPGVLPNPRGPQFQDRGGCIRATTYSGKRFYVETGSDQGHGIRVVYAGRNGMLTVDELNGQMISNIRESQYLDLPTSRYAMPSVDTQSQIQPCEVIDTSVSVLKALVQNQDSVSGEDGRCVIEVLVAAHQSAEHGSAPVLLNSELDRARVFPWA